jgi:hypothetical protein
MSGDESPTSTARIRQRINQLPPSVAVVFSCADRGAGHRGHQQGVQMRWIIAHQGYWDEVLIFVAPIGLALAAVGWANRRGARKRTQSGVDAKDRTP